jgi:hypothetical protein
MESGEKSCVAETFDQLDELLVDVDSARPS